MAVVADLRRRCDAIDQHFRERLVELRQNVGVNGKRNVARYGEPEAADEDEPDLDPNVDGIVFGLTGWSPRTPAVSPVALENKTIMTAHGKARTNRFNDARAFASHVHAQSPAAIAAFTIIVNTALKYRNPDAFARSARQTGVNKPLDAAGSVLI